MVLTQCDSLAVFWKSKWLKNKREETAGLSMAMRFPVQCSACQSGEKFKTNAGKRLCCAVLLCCVAVLCGVCVVRHAENSTLLTYMSASLFLLIF